MRGLLAAQWSAFTNPNGAIYNCVVRNDEGEKFQTEHYYIHVLDKQNCVQLVDAISSKDDST